MRTLSVSRYAFGISAAAALLAGCGGSQAPIGAPAAMPPSSEQNVEARPSAIYIANDAYQHASLTAYARNARGNAVPVRTIAGTSTQLKQPAAIAVDVRGRVYVANIYGGTLGNGNILIYAPGANGNAAPIATITEDMDYPEGIALDSSGNIYVANWQGQSITEYARGSYRLLRKIQGDLTGLYPVGVVVDGEGKLYALNNCECSSDRPSITIYAADASNNAAPLVTIGGPKTRLGKGSPMGGIAVDAAEEILVSEATYNSGSSVLVFSADAHGNVKPIRTISGPKTRLHQPYGLTLDDTGNIYVTASASLDGPGGVLVFAPNANRNVAPIREIAGSKTGLLSPSGIAIR